MQENYFMKINMDSGDGFVRSNLHFLIIFKTNIRKQAFRENVGH